MRFDALKKPPVLIITAAALLYSCSFEHSPKKTVEEMIETKNSRQVTAALEYYSEDAMLDIPKMGITMMGRESIRPIAEYDSAIHAVLRPSNFTLSGDTVFCSMTEHNDWIEASGIPDAYYPRTIHVVKDGKITYSYGELADSSKENFERVLDYFVHWGNEKYPEKMRKMAPMGEFVYTAENGVTVVQMLREWKAEQNQGANQPPSGLMPRRQDENK